jgi:hypothetical protein
LNRLIAVEEGGAEKAVAHATPAALGKYIDQPLQNHMQSEVEETGEKNGTGPVLKQTG